MSRAVLTPEVGLQWLEHGPPARAEIEVTYQALEPSAWNFDDWDIRGLARQAWISNFSFAIPCAEAIQAIRQHCPRVLECGAGTGYWAKLLANAGCDVLATEPRALQPSNGYRQAPGVHYPVQTIKAQKAVTQWPDRDLLMVWPCYTALWSDEAARGLAPGRKLVLVSEDSGGCVGSTQLFRRLDREFETLAEIEIPQWMGIHDRIGIWQKKGQDHG